MIDSKKVLAIIPARGGSKGVRRKNIRNLAGKPLIAWTIEEGRKSKYIDRLILSSEDVEIIEVAKSYGCDVPFVRPKELAKDNTPGIEPVLHAVSELEGYDFVVLLQPTSPLRTVTDIDKCIEKCILEKADACVSLVEADKSPYWMYYVDDRSKMSNIMYTEKKYSRRQDIPSVYVLNGAVYVANVGWLKVHKTFLTTNTISYIMPKKRSYDIDTELDFLICEKILQGN
ncbi:acylneuraminate cytidylyltransferase family protein [Bacillus sp. B190/17]|uniref:Acylneuraminate cytidylyltransferase family protein n=1 Tax=Bacillus lumedeiriae TaxID=3058829 RepID=A0ABW8ICN3_9BACI